MADKSLKLRAYAILNALWRGKIAWLAAGFLAAALAGLIAAAQSGAAIGAAVAVAIGLLALFGLAGLGFLVKLRAALAAISAAVDERRDEIRAESDRRTTEIATLHRRISDVRTAESDRRTAEIAKLRGRINDVRFANEKRSNELALWRRDLNLRFGRQRRLLKRTEAELSDLADRFGEESARLNTALTDVSASVKGYHIHDRTLSAKDLAVLRSEWAAPFGLKETDTSIGYLAHRIRTIESLCAGRLATSVQAMIARLLAARSIDRSEVRILEIGVLFGVGSACLYDALAGQGRSAHLTLIDPLDGYYAAGAADVITGVSVTRAVLERNLAIAGAPKSAYEIVQGLSTDAKIIAGLSGEEFDVLLIDGDHSYEGVRQDYEYYAPLVREGGLILFDDYGAREWPEIKRFVDEDPAHCPDFRRVAAGFRTAAFRVMTSRRAIRLDSAATLR